MILDATSLRTDAGSVIRSIFPQAVGIKIAKREITHASNVAVALTPLLIDDARKPGRRSLPPSWRRLGGLQKETSLLATLLEQSLQTAHHPEEPVSQATEKSLLQSLRRPPVTEMRHWLTVSGRWCHGLSDRWKFLVVKVVSQPPCESLLPKSCAG